MKQKQLRGPLALLAAALLFSSCASQEQYQDAVDLAKHYQDQLLNSELALAQAEAKNRKLTSEFADSQMQSMGDGAPMDAALRRRLDELQQRLSGLSSNPDGISKVSLADASYVFMVSEKVLFSSGSDEVNSEGRRALLEQVVADIKTSAHGRIWVRGHTDSVPVVKASTLKKFPHGNLQLSVARAIEVASILTGAGGIAQKDVVVAGFGPHEPLTTNDTAENRRLNRRVEIYVTPMK